MTDKPQLDESTEKLNERLTRRQPTKGVRSGRPHLEPPKGGSERDKLPDICSKCGKKIDWFEGWDSAITKGKILCRECRNVK